MRMPALVYVLAIALSSCMPIAEAQLRPPPPRRPPPPLARPPPPIGTAQPDVIVIGAGIAGARAAQYFASKAMKVVVLEARNRAGGRISTASATIGGQAVPIELGAAWLHGTTNQPLVPIATAAGVSIASRATRWNSGKIFGPTGADAWTLEAGWDATFNDFYDVYFYKRRSALGTSDPGMGSLAAEYITSKGLTGTNLLAFKYNLDTVLQHEYGGPIANLSLWHEQDSNPLAGGDVLVTGGYQKLVQHLLTGLDVRYSQQVTAIDYSATASVKVTTAAGLQLTAPWVVCTVPLGVLKRASIAFKPALPTTNTNAIAALGMGLLNKVVLVFPSAFWGTGIDLINRVDSNGAGAWEEFISMAPTAIAGKPVLVAFAAATYAQQMESKSDAVLVEEVMAVLRTAYGSTIPAPTQSFVTRWGSDPFACGSYSYTQRLASGSWTSYSNAHKNTGLPVGCSGCAIKRLHFAGEHTRVDYPATAHGAYMSGTDAGCAVLKLAGKAC